MEMTTLTFHDKKEPFSILTIKTRVNGWWKLWENIRFQC
jgi:hypothetical protein